MYLSEKTKTIQNDFFQRKLGITTEEFLNLSADKQQQLIQKNKSTNKESSATIPVMIGSGEHACFINVEKGQHIMLEDGTMIEAGLTPQEFTARINDRIDRMNKNSKVKKKV